MERTTPKRNWGDEMNNEQIIKDTAEYNFNLGFQKGKLEQKKEELKFLLEIKGELSSLVATKQLFLSGYNKLIFIQARIKQLQKEIGK